MEPPKYDISIRDEAKRLVAVLSQGKSIRSAFSIGQLLEFKNSIKMTRGFPEESGPPDIRDILARSEFWHFDDIGSEYGGRHEESVRLLRKLIMIYDSATDIDIHNHQQTLETEFESTPYTEFHRPRLLGKLIRFYNSAKAEIDIRNHQQTLKIEFESPPYTELHRLTPMKKLNGLLALEIEFVTIIDGYKTFHIFIDRTINDDILSLAELVTIFNVLNAAVPNRTAPQPFSVIGLSGNNLRRTNFQKGPAGSLISIEKVIPLEHADARTQRTLQATMFGRPKDATLT
ncbi:hypothetical protein FKW77_007109 [Venturia effusa]|uniref:Uncharacterized protein n=1 Tax=Venturia effusa TaxID=50376 RepID=A0A517LJ25_9PEZI|nr:hypothetical protein FKW77_007109 [Venturia effusa]